MARYDEDEARRRLQLERRNTKAKERATKQYMAAKGAGLLMAVAGGLAEAKFGNKARIGPTTWEGILGGLMVGGSAMMPDNAFLKPVVSDAGWAGVQAMARNSGEEWGRKWFGTEQKSLGPMREKEEKTSGALGYDGASDGASFGASLGNSLSAELSRALR